MASNHIPSPIDVVNMSTHEEATSAAFTLLDQLSGLQPAGLRLPAAAIMLILMCERFGIKPTELLDKSGRMLSDSLSIGRGEHTRAMQEFLRRDW